APDTRSVQLLSDARGNPARVAAVLFIDGRIVFTDVAPPEPLLRLFRERRDNQIGGLEVLSIALGLATFEPLLSGRCVNIFSDNSGSEWAVRSGAAKQFDHNCLVHSIWRMALDANCNLHVQRVASVDNIADLPSRESYSLLYRLGAEWIPPVLDDVGQGLASSLAHVAVALRLWAREGISGLSAHLENVIGVRAMALAGLLAQLRAVCPEARPLPVFAAAELLADNGADAVSDLVGVTLADFRGAAALSCDAREVVRAAIAAAQRGGAPAALGRGSAGASPAPAP
ncbi:unnamed protein product, partial [Prorocentrum cordatum]